MSDQSMSDSSFQRGGTAAMDDAGRNDLQSRLLDAVRIELVPKLVTANRVIGESQRDAGDDASHGGFCVSRVARDLYFTAGNIRTVDVARFVRLLRASGHDAAPAFVDILMARGIPRHELYLDLLGPAAKIIGEMWLEDECGFADVTIVLGRLQLILNGLRDATPRTPAGDDAASILLAAAPGDQHAFAISMVEAFFLDAGWRTTLPHMAEAEDLLALVSERHFDMVGLSIADDEQIANLVGLMRKLRVVSRNSRLMIVVGGPAVHRQTARSVVAAADAILDGGRQMAVTARKLLVDFHDFAS